jgi:prepilin-type N-terminal cleavage/methylation domain-containing protein/prepilin-type processing-associated H-X9-DG protein
MALTRNETPPLMNRPCGAFTLIELLVVVAIIGILVTLALIAYPAVVERGKQTASLNNMRQIGAGFQLFANDHDMGLPSRMESGDRWPKHLLPYVGDTKVYADPADRKNFLVMKTDPLSTYPNYTSYIMNGFNDAGTFRNESISVRVVSIDKPSQTILLAPAAGHTHFYMDFEEGNQTDMIKKKAFNGGSNYLFTDGSARFLKAVDYEDDLWLVHKGLNPY